MLQPCNAIFTSPGGLKGIILGEFFSHGNIIAVFA